MPRAPPSFTMALSTIFARVVFLHSPKQWSCAAFCTWSVSSVLNFTGFTMLYSPGLRETLIPAQVHHRRPLRKRLHDTFPVAHAALHGRIERNPVKDRANPKFHQQHREKRPVFF